jgi:hypothetical protein
MVHSAQIHPCLGDRRNSEKVLVVVHNCSSLTKRPKRPKLSLAKLRGVPYAPLDWEYDKKTSILPFLFNLDFLIFSFCFSWLSFFVLVVTIQKNKKTIGSKIDCLYVLLVEEHNLLENIIRIGAICSVVAIHLAAKFVSERTRVNRTARKKNNACRARRKFPAQFCGSKKGWRRWWLLVGVCSCVDWCCWLRSFVERGWQWSSQEAVIQNWEGWEEGGQFGCHIQHWVQGVQYVVVIAGG